MSSTFGSFETIAVVLTSVQLVSLFLTFVLVCRLKEFYQGESIDFGDYIKVPFNKAKTVHDLVG